MSEKRTALKFPKDFLWGAATAAHQVEGGLHNQWTEWEAEHAKVLAAQAPYTLNYMKSWPRIQKQAEDPDNYVSGRGVDHYQRYREDFQILKQLHMNAFRCSIEWSRIEPTEGAWDAAQIDHYRRYLGALKELGVTPIVTLFHFTLPVWFAKKGGFEKRRNVKYFIRFAEKILAEFGQELEWIITINEPTIYANESYLHGSWPPNKTGKWRAFCVLNNLLYAHRRVYKLTKRSRRHKVSIAHHYSEFYPGDDAWLTVKSAAWMDYRANHYALRRVAKYSDFLAVNYYGSNRVYGYRAHNPNERLSDLGWDMQPERLLYVLKEMDARYGLPVMISENGLADSRDAYRKWWLTETIKAMHGALKDDVKLIGYLHWSLLDNFEWDKGYWPKFGLVDVDRKTMKRRIRPSAIWLSEVIRKLSLS